MDFIKKNKNLLIIGAVIIIVLAAAFFSGSPVYENTVKNETFPTGQSFSSETEIVKNSDAVSEQVSINTESSYTFSESDSISSEESIIRSSVKKESSKAVSSKTEKPSEISKESRSNAVQTSIIETTQEYSDPVYDISQTEQPQQSVQSSLLSLQEQKSELSEISHTADVSKSEYEYSCSLFISCETALKNDRLDKTKRSVLPENGIIMPPSEVGFIEGESVYDVLKRECTARRIHLDFSAIPLTGGAYIKGIGNLYEFDCGPVSGWMYRVNNEFPNVGCSDYRLKNGDEIAFLYSCDLGADVGNEYKGG